ncbi:thioredoxin-domain-containing protein [Aspergillus steynii IBT 23096]|uniref:protein disulfide-isomerase n=1 Tax=Aspergillus steynii IBT 23096 TaxID=1392250 RepID=A0A2I2FWU7_9EURO|nr:thioredoxin-domain-containing protein [Aspergillus steynii IBT 23096]PLB45111.1 thioredoxin-domain-containing protein [Aspergillus steynii IBT 23096]
MILQPSSALLLVASLLAALPANADGLYTKKSPVLQVNNKNYDQLIANSNYTSILEFYAPWCGHCQNLKPAYEKAAKNLDGLAKVAAINCDEDDNKPLCGRMGVQGFPTLKVVVPGKKPGKPRVEDYQGARSAKAIVNAVVEKIPNHVKKVTDKDLESWLSKDKEAPKAILFTEKGTTSPLIRSVAIEFLGSVDVAQVRNNQAEAVEKFGIENFPAVVLVPGSEKNPIVYDGELKKGPLVEFLSQVATPNPDPAPKAGKSSKSSKSKTQAEKTKPTEASEPEAVPDEAQESQPAKASPQAPAIDELATVDALESACLLPKSGTCVLALLPEFDAELPESTKKALTSLSEIAHRHVQRKSKLFPFYSVPASNEGAKSLRTGLELSQDGKSVEVIVINGRRGWWRQYDPSESADYELARVEAWIDAIKLGEGSKSKLPEGIVKSEDEKAEEHDEL